MFSHVHLQLSCSAALIFVLDLKNYDWVQMKTCHIEIHIYVKILRVILNRKTLILNILTNIFILSAEMCYIINSYMNSSRSVAFFNFIRIIGTVIPHPKMGLRTVITG